MTDLVHEFIFHSAQRTPEAEALVYQDRRLDYAALAKDVQAAATGVLSLGLGRGERLAVYLEKRLETVVALFGTAAAGCVFVPVNPLLKPEQVAYILSDCNVRILVTTSDRLNLLVAVLPQCHDLHTVLVVGPAEELPDIPNVNILSWDDALCAGGAARAHRCIDSDMAAILYTSGSTGKPKGVVLSHRNMVAGAKSVAGYLENTAGDRILSVLPLSFDYGLSQLTTAFHVGATAVLMNYLLPRDILKSVEKQRITGLAAVPPLWIQLAQLNWPEQASLRYITNSGGAMQRTTLDALRKALPRTQVYLMYGLTEAFRSTYLPPAELDRRPDSMGKAIPNAEVMVLREDGSHCAPGEPGELVHRGALVALGYWNDPGKTAERFKPVSARQQGLPVPELAVWSGDTVRMDEEGFLYFVSRKDEMIKTSGYRVSPTEVEEVIYAMDHVDEAAAIGVSHPILGQAIVVVITARDGMQLDAESLLLACKPHLPAYMLPARIEIWSNSLPRNPNGKIDRKLLAHELQNIFAEAKG
ncbi:MAG: acyl-CoA ligase (AMP-forming), exosortase A system-associated [Oxalobacteraceae bacterium]